MGKEPSRQRSQCTGPEGRGSLTHSRVREASELREKSERRGVNTGAIRAEFYSNCGGKSLGVVFI